MTTLKTNDGGQPALVRLFLGIGFQKIVALGSALAVSIFLARTLGPENYGLYVFVSTFIPIGALLVSGGLPQLLTREIAKALHNEDGHNFWKTHRLTWRWVLASSLLIAAIGFAGYLAPGLENRWILIGLALLAVPFVSFEAIGSGFLKGFGKPNLSEMPKQVVQPLFFLLSIGLLVTNDAITVHNAIVAQIIAAAIAAGVSLSLMSSNLPGNTPPRPLTSEEIDNESSNIWRVALFTFGLIALLNNFNTQVAVLTLGFLGLETDAGAMRIAERAGQLIVMPLAIVNMIISPKLVQAFEQRDTTELQRIARSAAILSFLITLPAAGILWLYGDLLIEVTFGAAYIERALPAVVIIATGQVLSAFLGSVWPLLTMTGNERAALGGLAIAFATNIILCILLAPTYGATGAAFAAAASLVICKLIFSLKIRELLGVNSRLL